MHPMIKAVGVDEFKKMLDQFPEQYNDKYENNFKPVAMMIMWTAYKLNIEIPDNIGAIKAMVHAANINWKNGLTLTQSCEKIFQMHDHADNNATDATALTTLRAEYDKFKNDTTAYAESVAAALYKNNDEIDALKAENARLLGELANPCQTLPEKPKDGMTVYVAQIAKWKAYKPQARKQGFPTGRWQKFNGYGWSNLDYEPDFCVIPPKPEGESDAE